LNDGFQDDIEGAVARFEAFAKELRKLPQKFKLMERLIQVQGRFRTWEDLERKPTQSADCATDICWFPINNIPFVMT